MKKKTLRTGIAMLILFFAGALYIWFFVYNKPHKDFSSAEADFELTPQEIYDAYLTDYEKAINTYNGKMIALKGSPDAVEDVNGLVIAVFLLGEGDFGPQGVRCTFLEDIPYHLLKTGEPITIKGFCSGFTGDPSTGFSDGDVILEKCSVVKP